MTVGQVFDAVNSIAPFRTAAKWDNSGLLVGDRETEVTSALFALDITNDVVNEAVNKGANLIISHHPVIFNPLYTIGKDNPVYLMIKNGISAICAHTNFDMAEGGVNDVLIEALKLKPLNIPLETEKSTPYYQLVVFVPKTHAEQVRNAICHAGGGEQGEYSDCSFSCEGTGRFLPKENANPFLGKVGVPEEAEEVRMEMLVRPDRLKSVVSAMLEAHPYEEPAYQILENHALKSEIGFGNICTMEKAFSPRELAEHIKVCLGCRVVRYADGGKPIKKIAVCSGSGGSFLETAIAMGAEALITGDVKHDRLIDAKNMGISLFDAGHYHTENPAMLKLMENLKCMLGEDFRAELAESNSDPAEYTI